MDEQTAIDFLSDTYDTQYGSPDSVQPEKQFQTEDDVLAFLGESKPSIPDASKPGKAFNTDLDAEAFLESPETRKKPSFLERFGESQARIYESESKVGETTGRALGAVAGSLALMSGAGIRAAVDLIPTISPDPDKLSFKEGSFDKANKRFAEIMGFPTQLIRTPEEAKIVETVMLAAKPFEWAGDAGRFIGYGLNWALRELGLPADTYLEPLLATYGEAAAVLFGPKIFKGLKNSTAFRRLTVPERGLIVQSLADAKKANPNISEGELLRRYNNPAWFEEALKVREAAPTGETIPTATTPEPLPAEQVATELGRAGRFAQERASASEPVAREYLRPEEPKLPERQVPAVPPPPKPGPVQLYPPPPPVESAAELETRGRMGVERPSISEPSTRSPYYPAQYPPRPPVPGRLPAYEAPTVPAPAPEKVMQDLTRRMGYYDDVSTKIRNFAVLSSKQMTDTVREATNLIKSTDPRMVAEFVDVIRDTAKEIGLPTEGMKFGFMEEITPEMFDAKNIEETMREHAEMGETIDGETRGVAAFIDNMSDGSALIAFSMQIDTPETLRDVAMEEFYHRLQARFMPKDLKSKQMKYFGGSKEAEATAFVDYMNDPKSKTSQAHPTWLRSYWDKFIEFLTKIRNWVKGKGYHNPDEVFGMAARGEMRTPVGKPTEGTAAAAQSIDLTRPARAQEYDYAQKSGYPRRYADETRAEYESRIKTPAPKPGAEVEDAIYQGTTETDIHQQIPYHEWVDSKTGLPFTTDTPDAPSVAAEVKRLREDKYQFSTFDKSRKSVNVTKDVKEKRWGKVRREIQNIRESLLTPNTDSPLDKAGAAYLRTGKYADYVAEMPDLGELRPIDLFRIDPNTQKLIARLVPKGKGKAKPAIRQSGYYASQRFVDAFADWNEEAQQYVLKDGIKDVSPTAEQTMDPTRFLQTIDQGFFGGPTQQYVTWPMRMTIMAKMAYSDTHKVKLANSIDKYRITHKRDQEIVGDIIEFIEEKDAWADSSDRILKIPEVSKFLADYSPGKKSNMIDFAKALRIQFTQARREMNMARRKRKQPEIGFIKGYRPHMMEQTLKSRILGTKLTPEGVMQKPEMPDFIQPNAPFNPRALSRKGDIEYAKERNIVRLMIDYIETAAKDIYDTNIIHNNKIYAATLRSIGMPNAADGLERLTSEVFAGTAPIVTRAARRSVPETGLRALYGFRRNLTRAVFPLNFSWNMFIQTSSAGLTYARYGNKANIAGLQYLISPEIRQLVKQNVYSSVVKSRWGGKAAYQDVQGSVLKNKRLQSSKLDTAEAYGNFLTSAVEDALTGHAVVAAYYDGMKRGLTGRALVEYASEGGAKTQSMYNYQDVPGMLRNKEITSLFPFQTFAFEVFNTMREISPPVIHHVIGQAGAYESMSAKTIKLIGGGSGQEQTFSSASREGKALLEKRLMTIARLVAAIIVANAVVEKAIGRKPWVPSSFLPFMKYITGETWSWSGRYGMGPEIAAPQQYVAEFKQGVYNILKYGNMKKFRQWMVRYHLPAGIQVNRVADGIEAVAQGGQVKDVRGHKMYKIDPDEYWKAILLGPSKTTAGREYMETHSGKSKKKKSSSQRKYIPAEQLRKQK